MRLIRRASLKTPGWSVEDGPPVACPSGIVIGGASVAHYEVGTFRAGWRRNEHLALAGYVGGVLIGAHLEEPDDWGALLDAIRANPYLRRPRLAVGVDTGSGQTAWSRTVARGPWVVCDRIVVVPWESDEVQLLDARTGQPRRVLRGLMGDDCPGLAPLGIQGQLLLFSGASHVRSGDPYFAVDAVSGAVAWRQPLEAATRTLCGPSEFAAMPVGLASGHVIFRVGDRVVAFSCQSGEQVWTAVMPASHSAGHLALDLVLAGGPRPPGIAWIDAATGTVGSLPVASGLRGEWFDVLGTYRGHVV